MTKLSLVSAPRVTKRGDIEEIVKRLDIKKAKYISNWSNEMMVYGGHEIISSLLKNILNCSSEYGDT